MPDVFTVRRGMRTTTTVNPQDILPPDIDDVLYRADPTRSQLTTLLSLVKGGSAPKTKKIQVRQYNSFDPLDEITAVTLGTSGNSETRYARLTMAQRAVRPSTSDMFYQPGDRLALDNGQTVEIVMTPTKKLSTLASLTTALTGNTTTASAAGTVVVRNVERAAIRTTSVTNCQYLGHPIYEGEPVQSAPFQRDVVYDCNFVERIERTVQCTEDETMYIMNRGSVKDFDFQKKETLADLKQDVELIHMWGTREVDFTVRNQPKHHMGGLLYNIKSNVTVYNPYDTSDFENLLQDFMVDQAFKITPNGYTKTFLVGDRLHSKIMKQFGQYRRIDLKNNKDFEAAGLNISTYDFGGRVLKIMPYKHFRGGTKWEWWGACIDLPLIETRVKIPYRTINATLPGQRILTFGMEWAGTCAFHLEQSHALLCTA